VPTGQSVPAQWRITATESKVGRDANQLDLPMWLPLTLPRWRLQWLIRSDSDEPGRWA